MSNEDGNIDQQIRKDRSLRKSKHSSRKLREREIFFNNVNQMSRQYYQHRISLARKTRVIAHKEQNFQAEVQKCPVQNKEKKYFGLKHDK